MSLTNTVGNATATYGAAALAMFSTYSPAIVSVLGFILLVARLTYELPKAFHALQVTFKVKITPGDVKKE